MCLFSFRRSVKLARIAMMVILLSLSWQGVSFFKTYHLVQADEWIVDIDPRPSDNTPLVEMQRSVEDISQRITVRILGDIGMGSGVIVERNGDRYLVLTNHHVLEDNESETYTILTADGRRYSGHWLKSEKFSNLDLALVEFSSDRAYQVAEIETHNSLSVGDLVYAAGFPNWHFQPGLAEETRDWGFKAYQLTQGTVEMVSRKSLDRGYQIGYTNAIELGMSGGPILNQQGKLIGVNGRKKYPLTGIDAFVFADGTRPSAREAEQMIPLSWGIPISRLSLGNDPVEVEIDVNSLGDPLEGEILELGNPQNPFEGLFEPAYP